VPRSCAAGWCITRPGLETLPQATPLVEREHRQLHGDAVLDREGNILGHLAVFDERPMPAEPRRGFIFRIFAARATAEQERMRIEQRLQESEARYRDLFENAPNPYLIVGTDMRILSANRRVTELVGYSVEELVGAVITPSCRYPGRKKPSMEVDRKASGRRGGLVGDEPV
jgi:PAS domain-containing protein